MLIVCQLLNVYLIVIFGRIILSWFPLAPEGPMATVYGALYAVTEPVLGPVRRLLPAMPIDLSPLVILIAVNVVQRSIGC